LNRGNNTEKKKLYSLIINLPFADYEDDYEEDWEFIKNNQFLSEELENFLDYRHRIREKWVKCYMKQNFTCGTCTSSRIESKHRVYKNYLNGDSRLCQIFYCFKELEQKQFTSYEDEVKRLTKAQEGQTSKHILVEEVRKTYTPYVVRKVQEILLESIHYSVEVSREGRKW